MSKQQCLNLSLFRIEMMNNVLQSLERVRETPEEISELKTLEDWLEEFKEFVEG